MEYFANFVLLVLTLQCSASCFPMIEFPDTPKQEKLSRKQLCPGISSSSFRYHIPTKKCWKLGEKGPCGENTNMVFHSQENSTVYGECDCDFLDINVPLVYHPEKDACFTVYSQAYCEPSQWLVFTENNWEPSCVEDRCKDAILFDSDAGETVMIEFEGKCVPLNSRHPHCKSDQVVTFVLDKVLPTCGQILDTKEFDISNRSVYKSRTLSCRQGSRRDVTGKCRKAVTIKPSDDY